MGEVLLIFTTYTFEILLLDCYLQYFVASSQDKTRNSDAYTIRTEQAIKSIRGENLDLPFRNQSLYFCSHDHHLLRFPPFTKKFAPQKGFAQGQINLCALYLQNTILRSPVIVNEGVQKTLSTSLEIRFFPS